MNDAGWTGQGAAAGERVASPRSSGASEGRFILADPCRNRIIFPPCLEKDLRRRSRLLTPSALGSGRAGKDSVEQIVLYAPDTL